MLKWGKTFMKKMLIIIIVLAGILISMIIYKNMAVGSKNNINIQEIQKIEESISRRVTHLALRSAGDELRTIPEGCSGLHRIEIGECCHDKGNPSEDVVKQLVLLDHDS